MTADLETLALRCLAHLEKEDAMLAESSQLVQQTRTALLRRDQARLLELIDQQQRTARAAGRLLSARQALRGEIANRFGVPPESASIGYLATRVEGPLRERLVAYRRRLAATARRVDVMNRANIDLAARVMELLQGALERLTGKSFAPPCYERTGRVSRPVLAPHTE